ncbi:MAG: YlxR family protein [Bacilli bacterium]|nr:YlxR family protein [Bacilli bacterium]
MKKTPLRLCIVTRESLPKGSLLRIVKNKDGQVFVDDSFTLEGRGCYLKKDKNIILKAQKTNALSKALRCKVDSAIYQDLLNKIGG